MSDVKTTTVEEIEMSAEEALEGVESVEVAEKGKTGGTTTPLPRETKEAAYRLYMDHWTYSQICKELSIKHNTLAAWVSRESWHDTRAANDEVMLHDTLKPRAALISDLAHRILTGCLAAVERDSKKGFSAKELPTYLSALTSIEKLSRLSLGKATSISEERSKVAKFTLPLEQLKNVSQVKVQDPFTALEAPNSDAISVESKRTSSDSNDT